MAESIAVAQNKPDMLRLLLAQRKLYSDAKAMQNTRLVIVFAGAAASSIIALLAPTAVAVVSLLVGVGLILYSAFGAAREKTKAKQAATVQELFDCGVLNLAWNEICAARPTPQVVADAVTRSSGDTTNLRNWYPDTGSAPRPFDVLICQRSNLSWGTSMHRVWAAVLTAATVVIASLIIGVYVWRGLPFITLVPLLGPLGEAVSLIRAHRENAATKQSLEECVMGLWRRALRDPHDVGEVDLRRVQDLILGLRQTNANVPDWFHNRRRPANEASMQEAADASCRRFHWAARGGMRRRWPLRRC
jgi:hypothetical protein